MVIGEGSALAETGTGTAGPTDGAGGSRARGAGHARAPRRLRPGWPLTLLYLGFPLWWALGLAQLVFFAVAAAMAVHLGRAGSVRVPRGFGVWLLFLVWMAAGVFLLWADAPDTVPGGGPGRLVGFGVRAGWYAAATIAMLYVLNTDRELPTERITRVLGTMFVFTAGFGVAAVLWPSFEFRSPVEMLLPGSLASNHFVNTLVHPSLASSSDFLGYEHPRPTAPFPYSNAWGNNLAVFLPFFVLSWLGKDAGWRRQLAPFVLAGAAVPVTYSLNRGLWLALGVGLLYAAARLALNGRARTLQVLVASSVVAGFAFVSSPLYDTVALRIDTPHSNERRAGVATEVVTITAEGSPVAGYGTTRTMQGSLASLAGGATPECRQCAPPPLGTQGFLWRLVLTTGFVGTALCLGFLARQFLRRARGPAPVDIATCSVLLMAGVCFFVYDSLGPALFTVMVTVGLMARDRPGGAEEVA